MQENSGLNRKQTKALLALISEPTISAAALKAKVAESSIYAWLREDVFKAALAEARRQAFGQSLDELRQLAPQANKTLASVMDQTTYPSARVSAANAVYRTLIAADDMADLERRIQVLEALNAHE